jgi:hypothetical protein
MTSETLARVNANRTQWGAAAEGLARNLRLNRLVALVAVVLLAACGGARDELGDLNVTLDTGAPGEQVLVVTVTDASGQAVTDGAVALEGNMNHAGMVPVFSGPVRDDADGTADGVYRLPFEFTMLGDWIIGVTITQADGTDAKTHIDVNVAESGVTIK